MHAGGAFVLHELCAQAATRGTTNDGVNDPISTTWVTGEAGHRGRSRHRWFSDCDTGSGGDGGTERRLDVVLTASCCDRDACTRLLAGAVQIGGLVSKPNEHMEQDFADTYGEYLKEDGTRNAKAVMRMVANLLEAGLLPGKSKAGQLGTGAPMVPAFGLADSGFRDAVFCLRMVHVVCACKMRNADATISECLKHLAETGAKQDASDGFSFFDSPVTVGQAYKSGNEVARDFLNTWSEWIDLTRRESGNARAGTPVICAMLKRTESESPLTEPDQQRLWPLACWFEGWIPTIDSSFDQLTGTNSR